MRERERERHTHTHTHTQTHTGTRALMSKGVLINIVWAYILSYKVVILSKDKD